MKTIYEVAYDVASFINSTEQPSNRLTSLELEKATRDIESAIELYVTTGDFSDLKQYYERLREEVENGNREALYGVCAELSDYLFTRTRR